MLTKFYPAINKGGQPFFQSEADPATRHDSVPSESSQSDRRYERAPPPNAEVAKDIFQPDSHTRNWMMKHGKQNMVYYDKKQIHHIKGFFEQLDAENKGYIGVADVEEILVSLGLTQCRQDTENILAHIHKKQLRR